MPMKATDKTYLLRLPIETYAFFEEQAKKNKRSVNAELLIAIEERQNKIEEEHPKSSS
jgi:hypothetical protein